MVNEKADIQTKEMKEIEREYDIYKIVELNSSIQHKFQRKLLDSVYRFQFENEFNFTRNLEARSQTYNLLDFQVNEIQNQTQDMTIKLNQLKENMKKIQEMIDIIDFRNNNMLSENNFIEKNYMHDLKIMNYLYENLKLKSVVDIIKKFKDVTVK